MRKIILSSSLLLFAVLLSTSCKKDYTCTCYSYFYLSNSIYIDTAMITDEYLTQARAEEACQDWEAIYLSFGPNAVECETKVN